ncbi:DNZ54_00345 family protein [Pantoea sp. NPDC088449]|uniref:DNZ54_00345 family protein n=1 Tax=Pantoea sp. NPDC088449 TaxID=3364392 RepID=UPI003806877C
MKTKILNVIIDVVYIGLLIAGLRDPQSWLMNLPVAFTWLLNTFVWLAAFAGALALVAGGEAKTKMRAQLVLFFNRPAKGVLSRAYGWGMKMLIVISLAYSGWLITLISYVLTVVLYQLCRSMLSKPDAA